MLIILFDIRGIAYKEFVLVGQTANFEYYCEVFYSNCVKTCEDFAPNFGDKRIGCCITTTQTPFFHHGFFGQKQLPFSVSPIEETSKGSHFDMIEVMEAESQAVLNTLTEHDFRDAFKNVRRAGNGTTSKVMVASRPRVSFCPDGSTRR
jgi:hypothetical protein